MATRISTLDDGYQTGDLSLYPQAMDDYEQLYGARNNAETTLKQALSYGGKNIIVQDASAFPANGLLRVAAQNNEADPELVYYGSRTDSVFGGLIRGFAGSRQTTWSSGSLVSSSVMAEHHNAVKDAIINIQRHLGVATDPDADSLNGLISKLETKHLAPKPMFRASPLRGLPGMSVRFQNFSNGHVVRYLWDFGDGTTSIERSPTHVYAQEGMYTVRLNIVTSAGSHGISIKSNYITASATETTPFFYVVPVDPDSPDYSRQTADEVSGTPQTFSFVDQTDGDVLQRYWIFDDGEKDAVDDPDRHVTTHIYDQPGEYSPTLIVVFSNQRLKRVFLGEKVVVL